MDNELKIIRHLGLNPKEEKTIMKISHETKIPYMTANRIIKKLKGDGIILAKTSGKAIACSLNSRNRIVMHYLILASEAFKKEFINKKPLINKINSAIEESIRTSAILFGSYAQGKEQAHSDVDIAFITNSRKEIEKISAEFRTIEKIYDIEINTMAFTEKQFRGMLTAKEENVGKQILTNHVILSNPELFWKIVYEAENEL